MKTLSKEQVLILHARLIEATGGSNGIHDEGMLDSALANPFQLFGGKELYPSIQAKAAQLCFGLVKNHSMVDGNKRLGAHVKYILNIRLRISRDVPCVWIFLRRINLIKSIILRYNAVTEVPKQNEHAIIVVS